MSKKEFRVFTTEFRAADGNKIEGYAAVFGVPTDLGYFTESIRAGAFARAITENQDCRALVNHDPNMVMGRTKSGTLQLKEDNTGLHFSCDLPDTQLARDTHALVKRGDIDQCSFAFIARQEEVTFAEDGSCHREILDVDLLDVSVVTYPAYESTSCEARSVGEKVAELKAAKPEAEKRDSACECDCPECQAGNCKDCSDPECDDPNCEGSMSRSKNKRDSACDCECPECQAGDCAGCSDPECDDPNCEGSMSRSTNITPEQRERMVLRLKLGFTDLL